MAETIRLTPKQETFCLAYVETGNASEAYRRAYDAEAMKPASVNRKAKELLDNVKIAARIDELRESAVQRHDVTIDTIRDMLLEDRELAKETGKASAMVSASMGLARLYGLLSDKVDLTSSDGSMSPRGSKEQRDAAVEAYERMKNGG